MAAKAATESAYLLKMGLSHHALRVKTFSAQKSISPTAVLKRRHRSAFMKLRKIAIIILLSAAALALISYETYRSNAEFVNKLASSPGSAEMFSKLEPGIPLKSQVTGFFAVMLSATGVKLLITSYTRSAVGDSGDKMLSSES